MTQGFIFYWKVKAHLSDFCHSMMRASEYAVRFRQILARVGGIVGTNYVQHKAAFYQRMLTCPMQTMYKEFVEPLKIAVTFLGKAVVLACTNPTQLQKQAVLNFQLLAQAAKTEPEQMLAATISVFVPYGAKNFAQLKQLQPIFNAMREQKKLATACAVGQITDTAKKALEPIKTAVRKAGASTIIWTNHGFKHFPQKNMAWKDIIKSTKNGDARYKPGLNIETFERMAFEKGTPVTNGKTWKVFKADDIIGATSGIETPYMRIEISANTIHGHPITLAEYKQYLK